MSLPSASTGWRSWVPRYVYLTPYFWVISHGADPYIQDTNPTLRVRILNAVFPIFSAISSSCLLNINPPVFFTGFLWGLVFPDHWQKTVSDSITKVWQRFSWINRFGLLFPYSYILFPYTVPTAFFVAAGILGRYSSSGLARSLINRQKRVSETTYYSYLSAAVVLITAGFFGRFYSRNPVAGGSLSASTLQASAALASTSAISGLYHTHLR